MIFTLEAQEILKEVQLIPPVVLAKLEYLSKIYNDQLATIIFQRMLNATVEGISDIDNMVTGEIFSDYLCARTGIVDKDTL